MKKPHKGNREQCEHQEHVVGAVTLVVGPSAEQLGGASVWGKGGVVKTLGPGAVGEEVQHGAGEFVLKMEEDQGDQNLGNQ